MKTKTPKMIINFIKTLFSDSFKATKKEQDVLRGLQDAKNPPEMPKVKQIKTGD